VKQPHAILPNDVPRTIVVQIGNSDDKLTQKEWCNFILEVVGAVSRISPAVHFQGGSMPVSVWQNFCIVAESQSLDGLRGELCRLATKYRQESIALLVGDTEFVRPEGVLKPKKRRC
jgi:hypothetical protein